MCVIFTFPHIKNRVGKSCDHKFSIHMFGKTKQTWFDISTNCPLCRKSITNLIGRRSHSPVSPGYIPYGSPGFVYTPTSPSYSPLPNSLPIPPFSYYAETPYFNSWKKRTFLNINFVILSTPIPNKKEPHIRTVNFQPKPK